MGKLPTDSERERFRVNGFLSPIALIASSLLPRDCQAAGDRINVYRLPGGYPASLGLFDVSVGRIPVGRQDGREASSWNRPFSIAI
jgi:hypothetical protein